MWRSRNNRDGTTVVCIACGTSLPRSEAREYDKLGNRWERHGKSFEHLCKECYRELCHQPRDELEALLVDVERAVGAGGDTEVRADQGDSAGVPDRDVDPITERDAADHSADADPEPNLPVERDAVREDGERNDIRKDGEPDNIREGGERDDDTDQTFLAAYFRAVEDRYGPAEEPGRES